MKQLDLFPARSAEPDLPAADTFPMEDLPGRERAAALRRLRYVTALEHLPPGRRGDTHLRAAIKAVGEACGDARPPSAGSVRRWGSQLRRADGNLVGLAERRVARPRPPMQGYRVRHVACGRPLGEVLVGREVLRLGIPELGDGPVSLLTGRDTYSGAVVAAAVCTSEPAGDLLGLFAAATEAAASRPVRAARLCLGIPQMLLLDLDGEFRSRAFRDRAAALGITLDFIQTDSSDGHGCAKGLGPWLEAKGEAVGSADGLMAAVHGWLADHDRRPSRPDGRTPLDRWQEGVARYGINLVPISVDGASNRDDGLDGSGDVDAQPGR